MRARVWSGVVDHHFVRPILTENRTIEINGYRHFGLFSAQVGIGIAGPSLHRSNLRAVGLVTGRFFSSRPNQLVPQPLFGPKSVKAFSI
jgi:hypothetical protein